MAKSARKKRIYAKAVELLSDVKPSTPEERLKEFLSDCIEANLYVFVSTFVCNSAFHHSQPEKLTGDDIDLFISLADPFLQTKYVQKSEMA